MRSTWVRFELAELMMAIAIVMILAAIAIPQLYTAQLKARRAELDTNVDGLRTAEGAYQADQGSWYVDSSSSGYFLPDAFPAKSLRPWTGIAALGFVPDGLVRGSYTARSLGLTHCLASAFASIGCPAKLCVTGMVDLDADGTRACLYQTDVDNAKWVNPTKF